MQEAFEKIKQRIRIAATNACEYTLMTKVVSEEELKNIIDDVAAGYNNGWIPCSERLPENNQNVIACFAHGTVTELQFYDSRFHGIYDYDEKVIVAWMPLPEPYQPKGEQIDHKPTNAERIRHMSDEKLAELITSGDLCAICPFCKYYGTESCYMENEGVHKNCAEGIMEWLQSEVEE